MKHSPAGGDTDIDISQPHAIGEWAEALGVSPSELIDAVKKVGPRRDDIVAELEKGQAPHPGLY
jgi:hypothetical protein